ncbi:MAG: AraC family transcriptional regulator [Hydrococcus sp. Prado102]|jgi:AraC family transcriptional regulator|nr:AraC family transcriptional regulator [Hydrococcus sp. Prado102]
MPQKKYSRIDFRKKGSVLKIYSHLPLISSQKLGWKSINVDYYCQPSIHYPSLEESFAQHVIGLRLGPPTQQEMVFEGRFHSKTIGPGDSVLVPANLPHGSHCNNECEYIILSLEPTLFSHVAYECVNPDAIELIPHFAHSDPLLYGIGLTLKKELESGGDRGNLYVDSLYNALSMHLLHSYASRKPKIQQYESGLSKTQLDRVLEYINHHLEREIKLNDLAKVLGMSQYYFSRLFKQSMGVAPYEYVIQQRVERAKQLLKQRDVTIFDVATQCGFTHSSHLARHFKRLVGVAPQVFQKH